MPRLLQPQMEQAKEVICGDTPLKTLAELSQCGFHAMRIFRWDASETESGQF